MGSLTHSIRICIISDDYINFRALNMTFSSEIIEKPTNLFVQLLILTHS